MRQLGLEVRQQRQVRAGAAHLRQVHVHLEHRLAPGTRLREEELAQGFGVSRTVVRQALQRLAADHVIELQHNRGAQVPHPDPGQVQRVFEARRVVECDIVRRLAGRLEPGQLEALEALVAAEAGASAVRRAPEVLECHMVAGGFDYLVKTRVADMDAYRVFAGQVLWRLPGVRETRTYAVMEEVKSSAKLHIA